MAPRCAPGTAVRGAAFVSKRLPARRRSSFVGPRKRKGVPPLANKASVFRHGDYIFNCAPIYLIYGGFRPSVAVTYADNDASILMVYSPPNISFSSREEAVHYAYKWAREHVESSGA
jgi:hypothetical protein